MSPSLFALWSAPSKGVEQVFDEDLLQGGGSKLFRRGAKDKD